VLERVFCDHFRVEGEAGKTKANQELSATSLQSPDDLEATYRQKGGTSYHGYVANLSETCDPRNPLQLITKVQVAPNATDDSRLLAEALPNLKRRTELKTIYTDGGHGELGKRMLNCRNNRLPISRLRSAAAVPTPRSSTCPILRSN